jgi:hypothetical protein
LLTTDLELSDEETVRIYGKRWDIEVFFKMIKSYLGLAKEFQGRSYDRMVAHTSIVCTRYILLAIESREACDPRTFGNLFYLCCDELEDLKFATALLLIMNLFQAAVREIFIPTQAQLQELFGKFISSLPLYIKGLLGVQGCES